MFDILLITIFYSFTRLVRFLFLLVLWVACYFFAYLERLWQQFVPSSPSILLGIITISPFVSHLQFDLHSIGVMSFFHFVFLFCTSWTLILSPPFINFIYCCLAIILLSILYFLEFHCSFVDQRYQFVQFLQARPIRPIPFSHLYFSIRI